MMDTSKDAPNDILRSLMAEVIEQARKAPEVPAGHQHQVITVLHPEPQKPAPWHSWACLTACAISVVVTFVMVGMYIDLRRSHDRMEDYLHTIYMLVPDMKKMVDEKMKSNEKER